MSQSIDKPAEQNLMVLNDGRTTKLTKDWFYEEQKGKTSLDNFYPVREESHIHINICGLETLPLVRKALESAQKSICISLWAFDPALCLNGYNPDLNSQFDLFASLHPHYADSPRLGDIIMAAAQRGVQVKLLLWTGGELMFNPNALIELGKEIPEVSKVIEENWEGLQKSFDKNFPNTQIGRIYYKYATIIKDRTGLDLSKLIKKSSQFLYFPALCFVLLLIRLLLLRGAKSLPVFLYKNPDFIANWIYRYLWFSSLNSFANIELRTVGTPIDAVLVTKCMETIIEQTHNPENWPWGYNDEWVLEMVLTEAHTHHQKCVLVDYGTSNAMGFVMGNNLKMVDCDDKTHPWPMPKRLGRFPGNPPRQDLSTFLQGDILQDVWNNYERLWKNATPSFIYQQKKEPKPLYNGKNIIKPFIDNFAKNSSLTQLSATLMEFGGAEPGYIASAYKKAIHASTSYVYMENQYFRYKDIAQELKKHALNRKHASNKENRQPLYFFVVVNNPEPFALNTTLSMMEELGREGQVAGIAHHRYQELQEKRDKLYNEEGYSEEVEKINKEMKELESKYIQLKYIPPNVEEINNSLSRLEQERKKINRFLSRTPTSYQQALDQQATRERLQTIERKIEELKAQLPPPGLENGKQIPLSADNIERAEQAFLTQEITEETALAGHVATLLLCEKHTDILYTVQHPYRGFHDVYSYIPVNIHTKAMIIDDSFIIVGSANMHKRGMESDNEIDVSTAGSGEAQRVREELFRQMFRGTNSTIEKQNMSWNKLYYTWKDILDANWNLHYLREKLLGTLFYLYCPTLPSFIPTLD